MAEGVDYSWARPGGAALAAAGKTFAVRYLWAGGGKGLTAGEVAELHGHGIAVATVFESSGGRALSGYAAGQQDAQVAQGQLLDCGLPSTLPVYFAVDFDAQPNQLAAIDDYLHGAGSVLGQGRVGVYGSYIVTTHGRASGSAPWSWQTYAWSGGKVDTGAHLYQYLNGQNIHGGVDFVRSYQANFGQSGSTLTASAASFTVSIIPATGSNESSEPTSWIQERLNTYGYALKVDDQYGPATTAAVHDFEVRAGLSVDIGIAGAQVVAALTREPAPAPAQIAQPGKLIVDGIRQTLTIKAEQRALHVTDDGDFGPISIRAEDAHVGAPLNGRRDIKALQTHLGVRPDGIEGNLTVRAEQTHLNNGTF